MIVFAAAAAVLLGTAGDPVFAVPRKGPWIADVDTGSAEIRWEVTDPAHPGTLVVGTSSIAARVEGTIARGRVEGLAPDRAYEYRVDFEGVATKGHLLRTLPEEGQPVSFIAIGDTRSGHMTHARLSARIAAERPDFVVSTGDLVGDGRLEDHWQSFFEAERALLAIAPHFPAIGNHDARGLLNESQWERFFPPTRHREVRAGVVRLLFIDTNEAFGSRSKQGAWLRSRLERAKAERDHGKAVWIIAILHHPAFSSGHHGAQPSVRRELVPVFEELGVDLVLQGHDHIYERLESGGVTYVVSGGGGAPLYQVSGSPETKVAKSAHHYVKIDADRDRLSLVALGLDGETIDSVELLRGRERPARRAPVSDLPLHLGSVGIVGSFALIAWVLSVRVAGEKKAPASP